MVAQLTNGGAPPCGPPRVVAERDVRGPGCDARCQMVRALVSGQLGRSFMLLHHPAPHEEHGRQLGQAEDDDDERHIVRTGPLAVDLLACTVAVAGRPVALTTNELKLVLALARRPGVMLWYPALAAAVWGPGILDTPARSWLHMIRVNLARLRAKLGPAGPLVVTVAMMGMRLDLAEPCTTAPPEGYPRPLVTSRRWARAWDACRLCARTSSAHSGQGLCAMCRARGRRAPGVSSRWTRDWDACRDCGTTARRHYGHGYCQVCGRRRKRQEQREAYHGAPQSPRERA